jgi:hypothetical protein
MKNNTGAYVIEIGFRKYEGINVGGYGENKWENGTSARKYKKMCRWKKQWSFKKKNYTKHCQILKNREKLLKMRDDEGFFKTHYYGCYYESGNPRLCILPSYYKTRLSMCRICENISMYLK